MSLKQEIETWVAALAAYDNNEFDNALKCFECISDTSKILFNLGVIHATLGEHDKAVECYQRAVQLDQYLAVAYFQQGVSNFLLGDFEEALANFNDTLLYLRGNRWIDYDQLGLKFKLYSCEVLFNRGLCYIYLQQKDAGLQDLMYAAREKAVLDHDVIDEAIKEQAEGYTVFSIPVGVIYRPNEAKVKNLKKQDYLGKARLVAAYEQQHQDPRRQAALAAMGIDDRPGDKLSYGALNLVKPGLSSRSRQQSEPPMHRNVFPPTPPPELEKPETVQVQKRRSSESLHSQKSSVQASRPAAKPLRLELGAAAFDQKAQSERPRMGTKRSESERPQPRREFSDVSTRNSHEGPKRPEPRRSHTYAQVPEVQVQQDPIEAHSTTSAISISSPQSSYSRPNSQHKRSRSGAYSLHQAHQSIIEDPEGESEGFDTSSTLSASPPLAYEIVSPSKYSTRSRHHRSQSRCVAAPPPMRKIRIKVHAPEDTRYIMASAEPVYVALLEQIKVKFGLKGDVRLRIKDEDGDMVTVGDQDDLELAVQGCREAAMAEKAEMGKMEIWLKDA
ncbi:hypothetical protein Q7P37_004164 [Cladosporium fusiforme]